MTVSTGYTQPLVSIVMAAYNEERFIRESIESILQQSYPHFELIIINDGSTDTTEEIIHSYKDVRIRYIRNEQNLKLIESLNKGLRAAQGKYIARMDADDVMMPERLERQVEFLESNPGIGLCGAQLQLFGDQEGTMNYPLSHEDIRLHLLITSAFGNNVVMFRRELMQQHGLYFPVGYMHAEDFKCWTNWVQHTKVHNLDLLLVRYRSHVNSVSAKYKTVQRETRNRVRKEYATSLFGLEEYIAVHLTGRVGLEKYRALKKVLQINETKKIADPQKLKKILYKLWYLDSLEESEDGLSVVFRYPFIFLSDLPENFVNWMRLFKHYLKLKRN